MQLYFAEAEISQQLALFLAIEVPEVYFNYLGEHKFKRCTAEELVLVNYKFNVNKNINIKFDTLYDTLFQLQCPEWNIDPLSLVNKPDKTR